MSKESTFQCLADGWPSAFVARELVHKFSGGILNPRTMANNDWAGQGPEGRVRIGRKIAYPTASLIAWMESRAEVL